MTILKSRNQEEKNGVDDIEATDLASIALDVAIVVLIDFTACLVSHGKTFVIICASFLAFLLAINPIQPAINIVFF